MKFEDHFSTTPARFATDAMKTLIPLAVLFILGPFFYSDQYLFALLAVLITATNSLNIVYGFTGYLPFGFAVFIAFGAYTGAISINLLHFSLLESVLFGGLCSVVLSLLFTPLLKLNGAYFAIASLAAFEAIFYIFENGALTKITGGPYGISINIAYTPQLDYIIVIVVAIFSSLAILLIMRTNFGLALRAIKDERYSAEINGINTLKFRTYAWIISSFLTGLAGAMFGIYLGFFYPSGVFDLTEFSVLVIIFLIFGGKGTYIGPIFGSVILFFVYQYLIDFFPSYYLLVFGLLIIIVILFLPDGVIGVISKKFNGVF